MDGGGFSRAKEAAAPGQEPDQEVEYSCRRLLSQLLVTD